jgi:hypothetical protein
MLELRTATSLAKLWAEQGKSAEACEILSPLYHWFDEGLDLPDLSDADQVLRELSD